jgi:hypothetical protein
MQKEANKLRDASGIAQGVVTSPQRATYLYNRDCMLNFWHALGQPQEGNDSYDLNYRAENPATRCKPIEREPFFGINMVPNRKNDTFKPSESGYKVQKHATHESEVERSTRNCLNIICPDNFDRIVDRFKQTQIGSLADVRTVTHLFVDKALTEPRYCQTYARLVACVEGFFPEFPPIPERQSKRHQTFLTLLKDAVQEEFERNLAAAVEASAIEYTDVSESTRKVENCDRSRAIANMKLIGELFLWKLLPFKLVRQVAFELISEDATELMLECVCELLQAAGYTFDNDTSGGRSFVTQVLHRLAEHGISCTKRTQIIIQNLHDLRYGGWELKLLREEAKTKDDVKKDAENEAHHVQQGLEVSFATRIVGGRPPAFKDVEAIKAAAKAEPAIVEEPAKETSITFDRALVRRLLSYFAEERDPAQLAHDWAQARPSPEQARLGMQWLLELGFKQPTKDLCPDAIIELAARHVLPMATVQDALAATLASLDDADELLHNLFARLILTFGKERFDDMFIKALPPNQSHLQEIRDSMTAGISVALRRLGARQEVQQWR